MKFQSVKPPIAAEGTVVAFPFFKDLIIILGFLALIINLLMFIAYLIFFIKTKLVVLPRWLTLTNGIFLLAEFYFFFFL